MTTDPIHDLECANISKNFGAVRAVDDVSFEIPSGSFFSILGPSGCGKTTLMRMIAGFETPSAGDIRIKGRSVVSLAPNRRNVKMVFQHLALFPMMNVYENIAYGLRCSGTPKADIPGKVQNVLERIALPDVGEREIHQLSGGQKQRIAIARCMVLDPDVLLLDEPLGALDLKLREAMKIELKLLQHQFNTTFVYITHDQSEALVMSDRVAVMNNGRFEQIGRPQELYHAPTSAFVAGFVGDSNRWAGRVVDADAQSAKIETADGLVTECVQRAAHRLNGGDAVELFVRPEFITVGGKNGAASGGNTLTGIVDSILFNGANSRVLVRTASNALIEADVTLTGGDADFQEGDTVALNWSAENAMSFRTEAAAGHVNSGGQNAGRENAA
ncbi:MAG: ABC transporter ATP-binding protein [Alphaproteobacteria bacterium]|nr:ABC transporter ATP-binding protein [Alphaproteobacteria bacterium]